MILNSEAEIFVLSDFRAQTVRVCKTEQKPRQSQKQARTRANIKNTPALSNVKKREIEKKPC